MTAASRARGSGITPLRLVTALLLALVLPFGVSDARAQEFFQLKLESSLGTVRRGDGLPDETLRVLTGADQVWLAAGDLAALLQGTLYWRPEVQKLGFDVGGHRLAFSVGSEIVQIDGEESVHLPGPVFNREGQIFLPLAAFMEASGRPYSWLPVALRWEPAAKRLDIGAARPGLRSVSIVPGPSGERLEILLDRPVTARVELAGRSRTVLRLPEVALDPDTLRLPATGESFLALTAEGRLSGATISFATSGDIVGYSLQQYDRPPRVVVSLTNDVEAVRQRRFRPFPESGLSDTLALAVIVLDPGDGAGDVAGPADDGGTLSLDLARTLARVLEDSLGVRVVLTRDGARRVTDADRSEIANTARADLFLSLHYDRDAAAPRAVVAKPVARRTLARPLAELGFATWGEGSRDTPEASRSLAAFLVAELRQELGLPGGWDRGEPGAPREGVGESEGGPVVEWPVPLLQAVVMPAVYLVVEDLDGRGVGDPRHRERVAAALLRGIQRFRLSGAW